MSGERSKKKGRGDEQALQKDRLPPFVPLLAWPARRSRVEGDVARCRYTPLTSAGR